MRYRSIVSLLLVAVVTFLTSCSSPTVAKGPTYSPEQIAQLQDYVADVQEMRDRLLAIPPLVQQQRWNDVQTYIHGPLGEMRVRMSRLARGLEPKLQKEALNAAKEVFEHVVLIDEATVANDSRKALFNYNQALQDFDAFLKYVPAEALGSESVS
ncbi:MAG: photosystem II protein PsbQ [Leptolyngbyaceae cyanobacterium SL_7_1]|nr:photosystem II protein PsbQ [Leptolyngbyaceae cyanobacterium SL_7_1]